ncbi:hypothetical protein EHQ68_05535 [Leptospira congkakensis]|uniref:Aspartyl protease n=1 Tax=Leptospira congkakensis TaxID=2484932 RepID=A0A4Z1AIE5_9LEPT|nr:hypothetical protein [Leptospira congkakensis]TGL90876.1 hypothetical protein EHQ69_13295 [Leptospira congkakensis]TGL91885.1 hypothetical protein EHQ68_05535 [Leptospira congkakensis]TGL98938.1 hypothetical protein EHQ70_05130 [Leptospira congkakensis]
MSEYPLYQKVSVILFAFFYLGACVPGPVRSHQTAVLYQFPTSKPLPPHISVAVVDKGTHLLFTGIESEGKTFSFFWDTGSELSFYESTSTEEEKEFQLNGLKFTLKNKKGILPESFPGLLGLDFFQGTCIFWFGEELKRFTKDSPFCDQPDAYLSTDLKILNTKKKGDYYYVQFEYPEGYRSFGMVDTGSSLTMIPPGINDRILGEKKVFFPGNRILPAKLQETSSELYLIAKSGIREEYKQVQFLSGISLENFLLPGDKDKEEVWSIGLNVLRTRPLFWDFSRNRIGIVRTKN